MNDQWRDRLSSALAAKNLSQREVSIAAGCGPGYVNSILTEGKDPTLERLLRVCKAAGISFYEIVGGFEVTPETEEFLRLLTRAPPEVQQSVLTLLRQARVGAIAPKQIA